MEKIWLVGAGYMAKEYAKVLKALGREFIVIGRGKKTALDFEKALKVPVVAGGIDNYLFSSRVTPKQAIVAVDAPYLCEVTRKLLDFGVLNLLVENWCPECCWHKRTREIVDKEKGENLHRV